MIAHCSTWQYSTFATPAPDRMDKKAPLSDSDGDGDEDLHNDEEEQKRSSDHNFLRRFLLHTGGKRLRHPHFSASVFAVTETLSCVTPDAKARRNWRKKNVLQLKKSSVAQGQMVVDIAAP